jgi:hypothetical protein
MQKTLLSSTEDQTGYRPDELGSKGVEDQRFGRGLEIRIGWTRREV